MTRIESTSRPRSQTARTKRSTSTAVFPVPAPAETKTSPVASTAACCCSFTPAPMVPLRRPEGATQRKGEPLGSPESPSPERARARSCALHTAHRPQVAPGGALAALGVVANVADADPAGKLPCLQTRLVDRRPERLFLEVVVPGVAPERVALARAKEPSRLPLAGERPVQPAERLEADEVAQDEHVERDLETKLALDLARRVRVLARLVVLDDPARSERVLVDAVDLPGEGDTVAEVEPALELGRCALAAEQHLEPARDERQLRLALDAHHGLEIAPERRVELTRLHLGHVHAHALHGLVEAGAHQPHRFLDHAVVETLDPELLRQAREELVQSAVRDGSAQLRIDLRVDRARIEQALDEPGRRAVGKAFELGDVERRPQAELLQDERMPESRRADECTDGSFEPPFPSVRARQPVRRRSVVRRKPGECTQALPLGRCVVE